MCGRVSLTCERDRMLREFGIRQMEFEYPPRYNIPPSQQLVALGKRHGEFRASTLKWGLVPSWATDPAIGNKLTNARAETVAAKVSFKHAFERRRCLIVLDGFYEWLRKLNGEKLPYYFHFKDRRPFSVAGLWEVWNKDDPPLCTVAVITTEANALMSRIHDRMPVIVRSEDRETWLDPASDAHTLLHLLRPYEGDDLTAYRVSTLVNSVRNDGPDCIRVVEGDAE